MFSLQILSLLAALHGVILKVLRTESGAERGRVDIRCSYPKGYETSPKYWCRHPCSNADVLIKAEKQDFLHNVERFSLFDKAAECFFTVTIRNLTLQDSGAYFCGVHNKWFKDKYTKVQLTVSKAPPVTETTSNSLVCTSTLSPSAPTVNTQSSFTPGTHLLGVRETTSNRSVWASTLSPTGAGTIYIAVGSAFGAVVCLLTVSFVLLRKKTASSSVAAKPVTAMEPFNTAQEEEDLGHVYNNEDIFSFSSPHPEGSPLYSTLQYCKPSQEVNSTTFVTNH